MRGVVRTGWLTRPVLLGIGLALALVSADVFIAPEHGAARERRTLLTGRFELIVGFLDEPAYEGEPNGLYLRLTDFEPPTPTPDPDVTPTPDPNTTPDAEPTPGPKTEFQAEVRVGDQTRPLNLVQDANDPTIYRALFVPTQPGDYTFRIFGTLAGVEFSEEFRSSATTFPGVVGVGDVQFPAAVPVGLGLIDAFAQAEEDADRARTFGVVGVLLGVLGLLAGGLSIVLSRRPPSALHDGPPNVSVPTATVDRRIDSEDGG